MARILRYRISTWDMTEIKTVEVERETEKCHWANVWGGEFRRENKVGQGYRYFNSFEEAKHYLVIRAEQNLEAAQKAIPNAEGVLKKVQALKEQNSNG